MLLGSDIHVLDIIQIIILMTGDSLHQQINQYDRLKVDEMLEKAGNSDKYQLRMLLIFMTVFFFGAFIQMGFPIIFQPALFDCPEG